MNGQRTFILRMVLCLAAYAWLLGAAFPVFSPASAELISPRDPRRLGARLRHRLDLTYQQLFEMFGYREGRVEAQRPPVPNQLRRVLEGLRSKDEQRKREALIRLGLKAVLERDHIEQTLLQFPFHSLLITDNFDSDAEPEHVIVVETPYPWTRSPMYLVYVDESLTKSDPVVYEAVNAREWGLYVHDVNRDGRKDFILYTNESSGMGHTLEVVRIFNVIDGKIHHLASIILQCTFRLMSLAQTPHHLKESLLQDTFSPGDLRKFMVLREFDSEVQLLGSPGFHRWGGWKIGVTARSYFRWQQETRRYKVESEIFAITSSKDPHSQGSAPWPKDEYKKLVKICEDGAQPRFRRLNETTDD